MPFILGIKYCTLVFYIKFQGKTITKRLNQMESNTISQTAGTRFKIQIKEAAIILGITILMPFIIHLLPIVDNVPIGARLLPIFYAPLIAVIFFRWHVGLLAALLAPVINFLITGSPQWQVVIILTYELTLFVVFISLLKDIKIVRWFMGRWLI